MTRKSPGTSETLSYSGGGYTKNNVARCWTNETAILVGEELSEDLPPNLYHEYYQPDYKLNRSVLSTRQLDNQNMRSQVDAIRIAAMEHLRHLAHTPGETITCQPLVIHAIRAQEKHASIRCSDGNLQDQPFISENPSLLTGALCVETCELKLQPLPSSFS